MKVKTKQLLAVAFVLVASFFALPLKAQVTIGDSTAPQSFSILELATTTNVTGGLRLPQMTTDERDSITTSDFKTNPLAKGLMIFNTTTNGVDIWNGTVWIEFCGSPINHSIALPPVPSVAVTAGKQEKTPAE